jgi:hypothetical protein
MYNVKANRRMYNVKAKPPSIGCWKCQKHIESNKSSRLIVEEDLALLFSPGVTPNISVCGVALVVIFSMAVVLCRLDTHSKSYCSSGIRLFYLSEKSSKHWLRGVEVYRAKFSAPQGSKNLDMEVECLWWRHGWIFYCQQGRRSWRRQGRRSWRWYVEDHDDGEVESPDNTGVEFLDDAGSNFFMMQDRISSWRRVEFLHDAGSNFFTMQGRISSWRRVEFLHDAEVKFLHDAEVKFLVDAEVEFLETSGSNFLMTQGQISRW